MMNNTNIVFYSGFWYSIFSPIATNELSSLLNERKTVSKIQSDIRLLSLIFDTIHVPRSHLLTFQTTIHWAIVDKYLLTNDFFFFSRNGILLSSTRPLIDDYSDTERLLERVVDRGGSKSMHNSFIGKIKNIQSVKIDSAREARDNVDTFQQYIAILMSRDMKTGRVLNEIKRRSSFKETPFIHEIFIEELQKTTLIKDENKASIWKATNSIYVATGCLDLGSERRISIHKDIEDKFATHDNSGLLRELYSPDFIATLIVEELGEKYLIKFLNNKIEKISLFRHLSIWKEFKKDIFEMFDTLTQIEKIKPDIFSKFNAQQKLIAYKKYVLEEDKTTLANLAAELLEIAAGIFDPVSGNVVKTGKSYIAELLIKRFAEKKLSKKHHGYSLFWKEFKNLLDKIN